MGVVTINDYKQIQGFPDYYINRYGKVISRRVHRNNKTGSPMEIKAYKDTAGYLVVSLRNAEGVKKNCFVHILVAKAFIPNPSNLPYVNHKDMNPANPYFENLEWCSMEYNNNYSFEHGCKQRGCKCSLLVDGERINDFVSLTSAIEYAVEHYGSNFNRLMNFLKDENVEIVRQEPAVPCYKLYQGDICVFQSRYVKDCVEYGTKNYGVRMSHKKPYNVSNKLLIVKNDSVTPLEYWETNHQKHYNPVTHIWVVIIDNEVVNEFVGINSALDYIVSLYPNANLRSLRRNHCFENIELVKKDCIAK